MNGLGRRDLASGNSVVEQKREDYGASQRHISRAASKMRVHFYGGFAEKGRTCIGISHANTHLLLDAGFKTDDDPQSAYPAISPSDLANLTAIVVSHAHEDHAGALGWCLENGFTGEIWMTRETEQDFAATCADYLDPTQEDALSRTKIRFYESGQPLIFGDVTVTSGRSGHAVGGVWLAANAADKTVLYCADVVPHSPLLAMDPMPNSDLVLLDASYGDDPVSGTARTQQIIDWISSHPGPCVLPTPLIGRSLELLLAIPTPLSFHGDMVATLSAQLERTFWFQPGIAGRLQQRLTEAYHWYEGGPWPQHPLICHDGMGLGGPAEILIPRAQSAGTPILFTGHLPIGSPGDIAFKAGAAEFIRLPTHPTRDENVEIIRLCGASRVIGHSCTIEGLRDLAPHLPIPLETVQTGDRIEL